MRHSTVDAFMESVTPEPTSGCWLWAASSYGSGYGQFRGHHAHRAAWELFRGPIPDGLLACHKCDNRGCVNPDHIFLGTAKDNARDMVSKGRHAFQRDPSRAARGDRNGSRSAPESRPRGETQWQAELTDDLVREMRRTVRAGIVSARAWASRLGVSYSTTKRAINGRTWAHVALLLALVSLHASAEPRFQRCRSSQGRSTRGIQCDPGYQYSLFEFAPPTGAGMGTACACSTITGAKGETLTFSRASTATCTKGNPTTGIANGDLVTCASGQPRVGNPDGAGLKLLVEGSRTNSTLQSQAFDNAAWTKFGQAGAAAPTVSANVTVAPDGTTTAEDIAFAATTAGQMSVALQGVSNAAAWSVGVYLRGTTTTPSGTLDLCLDNAASAQCSACPFVSTSWTWCKLENVTSRASGQIYVGNGTVLNGGTNRSAQTVSVWQADAQLGAYLTSPIPTTTAAVTRAVEPLPTFAAPASMQSSATGSLAVTLIPYTTSLVATGGLSLNGTAGAIDTILHNNAGTTDLYVGGAVRTGTGASLVAGSSNRWAGYWGGGTVAQVLNGVTTSAAASPSTGATLTTIGIDGYAAGGTTDGYVGNVCIDTSSTRCR